MSEEESKAAIKKVYEQGYHEGFIGACNVITPALTEAITSVVTKLKEMGQKAEAEVVDEHEVENNGEKD